MEFINVKNFQDEENKRAFEKIKQKFRQYFVRKKINNMSKNAFSKMIVAKTLTAATAVDVNP